MAPYTYYYFFSIIAVCGLVLYLINLVLLRTRGKTTYGQSYKAGTPEYKGVVKFANNVNITISLILTIVFVANLANSAIRIARLGTQNAYLLLVIAPVVTILGFGLMVYRMRGLYGNDGQGMAKHNKKGSSDGKSKDRSTWLT